MFARARTTLISHTHTQHMWLSMECVGVGQGLHYLVFCADLRRGPAEPAPRDWAQRITPRCAREKEREEWKAT